MPKQDEYDAFLVITDISGYTGLIKANAHAVKHAQYVVSELMDAVLAAAVPPLAPAKLEGDAVFFAAPDREGAAEAVSRSLPAIFAAFDARRGALTAANTCHCHACKSIPGLELKAVVHRGPVHAYTLHGFSELAGYDIIVAHRLLKNSVKGNRYLLVTDSAWERLALDAGEARGHVEHYDDVGRVPLKLLTPGAPPAPPPPAGPLGKAAEFLRKGVRSTWPRWRRGR